jgi:CRISPR/Cas system-associated endonuclease Cas1
MTNDKIVFIDMPGATVMSRSGRLYLRANNEITEINSKITVIMACGHGFVITSDAVAVCARHHIEVMMTNVSQKFVAVYADAGVCDASRAGSTTRMLQFEALLDAQKRVAVAKDVVRRKVIAEGHEKGVQEAFLANLARCQDVAAARHLEAKSAAEWWRRWKDFELAFARGFNPPAQWRTFKTRYIGRRQGKSGELARQFTPRFAETPLQAMHNFVVAVAVARMTRVIVAKGFDPCFGFLHDGRKPGRMSLAWDCIEACRPKLATAVFDYAGKREFERAEFMSQDGVVRLSSHIAARDSGCFR